MSKINLHNYEAFLLDYSEGNLDAYDIAELEAFVIEHPELEINLDNPSLPVIPEEIIPVNFKSSLRKEETDLYNEELLNYIEGNLQEKEITAFETKLINDPYLAKELELYRRTYLIPGQDIVYEYKQDLIRTEEDLVLNNELIAYIENTFSHSEKIIFEKDLQSNPGLQKELHLASKTILTPDVSIIYPEKNILKKKNKVIALFDIKTVGSVAAAILLLIGFAILYNHNNPNETTKTSIAKKSPGNKNKREPVLNNITETSPAEQNSSGKRLQNTGIKKNRLNKYSNTDPGEMNITKNLQKSNPGKENTEMNVARQEEKKEALPPIIEKQNREEAKVEMASIIQTENKTDTLTEKHNYLLTAEETNEEASDSKKPDKMKLWKRAVQLAKQANKFGVKSIDGEEDSKNKFRISFNSFSVEKK